MRPKKLIAGNWKMNMDWAGAAALAREVLSMAAPDVLTRADVLICPPFVHLGIVGEILRGGPVMLGAQDCSPHTGGAHTGDISAAMLKDMGCTHVIIGHSERRQNHAESSRAVHDKARTAHAAGLTAIICVGETDAERSAGEAENIVKQQILESIPDGANAHNTVIAYEPVWAIGTGKNATPQDANAMHAFIRSISAAIASMTILYGGSMKPDNAAALLAMPDIDGGLIGGASLKAADFMAIAKAF